MYYDLIASLPPLPYFDRAERLPLTELRLNQRFRLLRPAHAEQFERVRPLVQWRPERPLGRTDAVVLAQHAALRSVALAPSLRGYVEFRRDQQALVAALRRKQAGLDALEPAVSSLPRLHDIRRHWEAPDFHLAYVYPWLPAARELLASGDARGLERCLMNVAWRWLERCAEQNMFSFEAVFSYLFRWDILQAWLASNAERGTVRFRELIDQVVDKVNHVESN